MVEGINKFPSVYCLSLSIWGRELKNLQKTTYYHETKDLYMRMLSKEDRISQENVMEDTSIGLYDVFYHGIIFRT